MYFCKIENFAYGEINERSFSNPTTGPFIETRENLNTKTRVVPIVCITMPS